MGCGGGDAAALGDGVWTEAQGGLPGCGGEKLSALRVLRTLPALSDSRGSLHRPPRRPPPPQGTARACVHTCASATHGRAEPRRKSASSARKQCFLCVLSLLLLPLKTPCGEDFGELNSQLYLVIRVLSLGAMPLQWPALDFFDSQATRAESVPRASHRKRSLGTLIAHTHRCRTAGAHVDEALFPAAQAPEHLPCLVRKRVSTHFRADGGSCKLVLFVLCLEK